MHKKITMTMLSAAIILFMSANVVLASEDGVEEMNMNNETVQEEVLEMESSDSEDLILSDSETNEESYFAAAEEANEIVTEMDQLVEDELDESVDDEIIENNECDYLIIRNNVVTGLTEQALEMPTLELVIPKEVTAIAKYAFKGRDNLISVTFEEGSCLTTIGDYAFQDTGITSITIPKSVTTINSGAFFHAEKLTTLLFEEGCKLKTIGFYAFSKTKITDICFPAMLTSINLEKMQLTSLKNISFEKGSQLRQIDDQTFAPLSGVCNLTSICIPKSVTNISEDAFYNFKNLESVTFEEGSQLASIGHSAFRLTGISNITIPKNVTTIGEMAFDDAEALETVTFEKGSKLQKIGKYAFRNTKISSICFPTDIVFIDADEYGINGVKTITFEEGSKLRTIPEEAFYNTNITSIRIPKSVVTVNDYAFSACKDLTSVIFEEGSTLTSIGIGAFGGTGITDIVIPKSVTTIKNEAFYGAKALETVTFEEGSLLKTIGDNAFGETGIKSICYPTRLVSINPGALGLDKLQAVAFEKGSQIKTIEDEAFYKSEITSISIPKSVVSIGNQAFALCDKLVNVTFEEGSQLTSIGDGAFSGTKLTSISIPKSVENIKNYAFSGLTTLETVTFEEGSKLKSIGESAFSNTGIININIPNTIKLIGAGAFLESKIEKVTFEKGSQQVTIGNVAFDYYNNDNLTFYVYAGNPVYYSLKNAIPDNVKIVILGSINYQLNGGINDISNPVKFETGDELEIKNPSRKGYTFAGWYMDARFTGETITSTSEFKDNVILYAKWNPITYTIKYDQNKPGSTDYKLEKEVPQTVATYDKTSKIELNKSTLYKYAFTAWNTEADGTGTSYKAGAQVKNLTSEDGEVITLYAQWKPLTYNVKYDSNAANYNGSSTGSVKASTMIFDDESNATRMNGFSIVGYKFIEWNTRADGKGLSFGTDENGKEEVGTVLESVYAKDANANVTLYAQWEIEKHNLKLNYNYEGAKEAKEIEIDVKTVLSANGIERTGYTLKNWNTRADGKGKSYALNAKGITTDLELYAQWSTPVAYNVSYMLEGGNNSAKNPKKYTVVSNIADCTLYQPIKRGYTFIKWVDATEENPLTADGIDILPIDDPRNICLKAVWKENKYKIVFNGNSSEYTDTETKEHEYLYTQIIDMFQVEKEFLFTDKAKQENKGIVGWTTLPNGGTKYNVEKNYSKLTDANYDSETGAGIINLYAKWGTDTYKITYVSQGKIKNTNPLYYAFNNRNAVNIKNPTRDGYLFVHWEEKTSTGGYDADKKQIVAGTKGDIELEAVWTPIKYTVKCNVNSSDPIVKGAVKDDPKILFSNVPYDEGVEINTDEIIDLTNEKLNAAYEFIGWNTKSNGQGQWLSITGKDTYSAKELSKTNNANVTVYAIWKPKTYGITYVNIDPEDSKIELSAVTNKNAFTYTYSTTRVVNLSNPSKYGFVFRSWYLDKAMTIPCKSIPKNSTGDITIYGKWLVK